MEQAILGKDGYALNDGEIIVHNYDGETREYISSPGAQVNRLKRMESLLLADACPVGRSNRKKERMMYEKNRFISWFVLFRWQI